MTCGCCHPESFRENDNRVFGYVVADKPGSAGTEIRKLHFVGAEHVLSDEPKGRVRDRPSLRILRKIMRSGDKLILADEKALGTKPAYVDANMAAIEAQGVEVAFIRKEYFEGD